MEIAPPSAAVAASGLPTRGDNPAAQAVTASGARSIEDGSLADRPAVRVTIQAPSQMPPDDGSGWVGVSEALYRLASNWSPALHAGKSAVVSLPRPDVIAAYHRDDPPLPELEAQRAAVVAAHFDVVV